MPFEFVLLGPVEALTDDAALALGGAKPRILLALLLFARGRTLSADTLADELWDGSPPASARKTLQAHMSRLRQTLHTGHGGPTLRAHWPGYELAVDPAAVDAFRFEALYQAGVRAWQDGDVEASSDTLHAALDLWRGSACEGTLGSGMVASAASRLEQLRLDAVELRLDADLALGRYREVAIDVEPLVTAYPLREHLHGLRMAALYGSGRQIEALGAYQIARDLLLEGLGVEPCRQLQQLQREILNQEEPDRLVPVLARSA